MDEIATFKKWKPSVFNVIQEYKQKYILFNTASSSLLMVSPDQYRLIDGCLREIGENGFSSNSRLQTVLSEQTFIVPAGQDEMEKEHRRFLQNKYSLDSVFFTIAPTMGCNLKCSYCFQGNLESRGLMTPEIRRGIVDFFRRKAQNCKEAVVQWFGGEPLLGFDMIRELSAKFKAICDRNNTRYYSEILTNGTLLSPEMIPQLGEISVKAVQFTLDGLPGTFARRKGIKSEKAHAYYRFLADHLHEILDVTGSVVMRINIDKGNLDEAKTIVKWFKDQGITDRRIDFRLGFINDNKGLVDCVPHDCLSENQFRDIQVDFKYFLADMGYMVYSFPGPVGHPCIAARQNAYVIDPLGNIGKCVPEIGQPGVTNWHLDSVNQNSEREPGDMAGSAVYDDFDPFTSSKCKRCAFLPVCQGQCPRLHHINPDFPCAAKAKIADKLAFYHEFYYGDRWKPDNPNYNH